MEKPIAYLHYSLDVVCPKCKESFDIIEKNDNDHDISGYLFRDQWEDLEGHDVVCDHCDHEFKIEKVEY